MVCQVKSLVPVIGDTGFALAPDQTASQVSYSGFGTSNVDSALNTLNQTKVENISGLNVVYGASLVTPIYQQTKNGINSGFGLDIVAATTLKAGVMSSADKTKLDALTANYKSHFDTLALLQAAHPTALDGDWAIVRNPVGPAQHYSWDSNSSSWEAVDYTAITGTTNLSYVPSPSNGVVSSDTGADATIPVVDGTNAGLATPTNFNYWNTQGALADTNALALTQLGVDNLTDSVFNTTSGSIGIGINTLLGSQNTSLGDAALNANSTGVGNTAVGFIALLSNTTGGSNTTIGAYSMSSNTVGVSNSANGADSLRFNVSGSFNVAFGRGALYSNQSGSNNAANGAYALYSNTTGSSNVANGMYALHDNTTGSFQIAIGYTSLYANTTGSNNVGVGYATLRFNTTGTNNLALGHTTMYDNTVGSNNIACGYSALRFNISGSNNAANGAYALYSNTTGSGNTAAGNSTLHDNTTGSNNIANGYSTLYSNTTGSNNVGSGYAALYYSLAGSNNVAVGDSAGRFGTGSVSVTTPNSSTFIGSGTRSFNSGGTNETVIGANAIGHGGNTVRIGDALVTGLFSQVALSVTSDERDKGDIKSLPLGLDFVMKLEPKKFKYLDARGGVPTGEYKHGFLAQDVLAALVDNDHAIVNSTNEDKLTLTETALIPVLVNAIQELTARIEELENANNATS